MDMSRGFPEAGLSKDSRLYATFAADETCRARNGRAKAREAELT
jgi:hypothetical protein